MEDYSEGLTIYTKENVTEDGYTGNSVPIEIPFLPLGLLIIVVTLLGIIGNFLSWLVLSRRRLQSSYSVLTIGLTVVDTVYLLTKLLRYGIASFFTYFNIASQYTNVFLQIVGPYLRPITFTANTASTYFTIAIALDRYIAVQHPLTARSFCTRHRARYSAAIVLLFSILYNLSRWWEFQTVTSIELSSKNQSYTKHSMEITELRTNPNYKLYYIFWAYFVVMFVVPFTSLTFLNFRIWIGIRRTVQNGVTLTSVQSRDNSFATMLVGVVFVFLLCNLDYLVLDLMEFFEIEFSVFWNYLGNFLLTVNSAINFIIYCVCGWKFREELSKMSTGITCCRRGKTGTHAINTSGQYMTTEYEKDSYYTTQNFHMESPTIKSAPM